MAADSNPTNARGAARVTMKGGAYFFMPGLSVLRYLARPLATP
jgi:hypothetical protein